MSQKDKTIAPTKIGDGKPGAKSRVLTSHAPLLESSGFETYPMRLLTPDWSRVLLSKLGVSYKDPKQAKRTLAQYDFSAEKNDLMTLLHPMISLPIVLRSDDPVPDGTGLWPSKALFFDEGEEAFNTAIETLRHILMADFHPNIIAFKKRAGIQLEEVSGMIAMPLAYGSKFGEPELHSPTTFIHINAITHFHGEDTFVVLGLGIGGANNTGPASFMLSTPCILGIQNLNGENKTRAKFLRPLPTNLQNIQQQYLDTIIFTIPTAYIPTIAPLLQTLSASPQEPLYVELALQAPNVFVAVQCAPVDFPDTVEKPDVPQDQIVSSLSENRFDNFGVKVLGRGVVETNHVVVAAASRESRKQLAEINAEAEPGSYTLILMNCDAADLARFPVTEYSNAGAILLNTSRIQYHAILSHSGGTLRSLGIPVLQGPVDPDFTKDFTYNQIHTQKLIVYADDSQQQGFAAKV